uniref:Uncharacterized protein n=1 Tax=Arundo donax TaxID=35708 RepID=A0A0A9FBF8_ARUDO
MPQLPQEVNLSLMKKKRVKL